MKSDVSRTTIASVASGTDMEELLARIGDEVARDAAVLAPKRTGAGAASIRAETGRDEQGLYVRVSWDQSHFYMGFAELGTSQQNATPFLRPALERRRSI